MDSTGDLEDPSQELLGEDSTEGDEEERLAEEDEDAFIMLSKCTQSPDAVPWEQRTTKMKIVYVADRVFLSFLALFVFVIALEIVYKVAYLVHWQLIYQFLVSWMLTQEEEEEMLEL